MLLDADKNGRIDLDEFVSGCMQLHGPAKSLQLAKMSMENKFLGYKCQPYFTGTPKTFSLLLPRLPSFWGYTNTTQTSCSEQLARLACWDGPWNRFGHCQG